MKTKVKFIDNFWYLPKIKQKQLIKKFKFFKMNKKKEKFHL